MGFVCGVKKKKGSSQDFIIVDPVNPFANHQLFKKAICIRSDYIYDNDFVTMVTMSAGILSIRK